MHQELTERLKQSARAHFQKPFGQELSVALNKKLELQSISRETPLQQFFFEAWASSGEHLPEQLSILDAVWLYILMELKSLHPDSATIEKAKDFLCCELEESDAKYPMLEYLVSQLLLSPATCLLIITDEGVGCCLPETDSMDGVKGKVEQGGILLNLTGIIREKLPDLLPASTEYYATFQLSEAERKLITLIRMKRFQSVNIRMKEGLPYLFEGLERVENEKRIIDILKEEKFQDIQLKQESGKVVCIHRTVKERL